MNWENRLPPYSKLYHLDNPETTEKKIQKVKRKQNKIRNKKVRKKGKRRRKQNIRFLENVYYQLLLILLFYLISIYFFLVSGFGGGRCRFLFLL